MEVSETIAVPGAGGTMGFAKDASLVGESALQHGLDRPVFATIAERLSEGALDHGDEDFSATFLTSAPERAA